MKLLLPLLFAPALLLGQATPTVKQAPPPGIAVPEADEAELQTGLDALGRQIEGVRRISNISVDVRALLPDAEVLHKAVRYALQYHEFFNAKEIAAAKAQLALGQQRAKELINEVKVGKPSWATATGPLVLGYTSKIDGSVQPYGLIVPDDWKPGDTTPRPLYLWFHGRGDTLSEVSFIAGRLKAKRDFATPNAFELHLYGRYCNASKFAGETDCFEAMADVQRRYSIDPNRIVEMGFSMGGATGWHMAAHHPGLWAVGSAGAGFAETEIYAQVDDPTKEPPAPWERKLFRLYDCPPIAANYGNLPFIAYSGELDPQKQSADIMEKAMVEAGLKMEWIIGPGVKHQYEPAAKKELARRIDAYVAQGCNPVPEHIRFETFTLRYNQCKWVTLDALEQHWEKAEIDATIVGKDAFRITTKNVAAFTIGTAAVGNRFPPGPPPKYTAPPPTVLIDGQELTLGKERWYRNFQKTDGKWTERSGERVMFLEAPPGQRPVSMGTLAKISRLQGPIDDAFMESFIFVRPTGIALNEKVGAWAQSELDRAIIEWRKVFRGDVRIIDDTALTAADSDRANIILWGDPGSNSALAKMLPKLPIQWTKNTLTMGKETATAADHAPIFIYPNPENPNRYVVLNSSFTFRQGSTTSNSLQTPKLPDWALIDLNTPPDLKWPGQVVNAGFFDEAWQWKQ